MNRYVDAKTAGKLRGVTPQWIRIMCAKGRLPGAIKKNGKWWIPITAHPDLAEAEAKNFDADDFAQIAKHKKDDAVERLGVINEFEKFAAENSKNCKNRNKLLNLFTAAHNIKKRTLQRWLARYRHRGLLGLVDTRGRTNGKDAISPEAFELFKSMYLTQQKLSVKTCLQNVCFVNKSQDEGWRLPSLDFMYKYINRQIPAPVQVLHREGLAAYQAKYAPYIQSEPDSVQPGQLWVGDHHQFNCWIRHRGKWVRPWLTAWEDYRSRTITGFHISTSPNQTTILRAMKKAIESYGPPDAVKIDNGRDYDSQMWTGTTKAKRRALRKGYIDEFMVTGIYAMLDVTVSFALPHRPQSKSIERWFDTLDCQFTKTIATYCGKDSERKPDYLKDLLQSEKANAAAYDIDSFAELVGEYVKVYNNSAHSGAGMDKRAPLEVLGQRRSRRVLIEGVIELLLRAWSGEISVGKNGVRFKNMHYGQFNPYLLAYQGKKVRVAFDPDNLAVVDVYDTVTLKLVTRAEQNELVRYGPGVSDEAYREATRQKANALKIARAYKNSRLTANMDIASLSIRAAASQIDNRKSRIENQATLRPVKTPFDTQVAEHKRQDVVRAVKKAAGAESTRTVLDMDFSALNPNKQTRRKIFDE